MSRKKKYTGYFYLLPWLIGFLAFQLYPLMSTLVYSFTNYSLGKNMRFSGLDNYIFMFTKDPHFFQSLKVTFLYVLMAVPMKLLFALLVAIMMNTKMRGISFFRAIYYLPSLFGGSVAVAILWRVLFINNGFVNNLLAAVHLPTVSWYAPNMALFTISLITVWQFGSSMVIFLAGLKQIPQELYEAARVDGASNLRMFTAITFPLLTPIVFFNLVMQMINAFQEFTAGFLVTQGGPMLATYLFGIKLYEEAFRNFKMGYASALSFLLFLLISIFTLLIFKSSGSWVHYDDEEGAK